jgi:hypothetical protein
MLRPADGRCRVHAEDPGDDGVVAEHPDRGEVLLHARRGQRMRLDVSSDDPRLQLLEPHAVPLTPRAKPRHGAGVGRESVAIPDLRGEKLQEPATRVVPGVGDQRRHR